MIYLIHLDTPLAHARHYIGYTTRLSARLAEHQSNNGSPMLRAATAAGIQWQVVRTWPGGNRAFERHLKNQKNAWRSCPICNPINSHNYNKEVTP